jgi:hypothetical protein
MYAPSSDHDVFYCKQEKATPAVMSSDDSMDEYVVEVDDARSSSQENKEVIWSAFSCKILRFSRHLCLMLDVHIANLTFQLLTVVHMTLKITLFYCSNFTLLLTYLF